MVRLLPEPDSPTTHRVWPARTAKETPSTTRRMPCGVSSSVTSPSTARTGSPAVVMSRSGAAGSVHLRRVHPQDLAS